MHENVIGIWTWVNANIEVNLGTCAVFTVVLFLSSCLIGRDKCTVPGPPSLPFLGNIFFIINMRRNKKRHLTTLKLRQMFGDVVRLKLGRETFVLLFGYKNIHENFVEKKDIFSNRPKNFVHVERATRMGKGIVWNSGQQWKDLRKFALQWFRDVGIGNGYVQEIIQTEANSLSKLFETYDGEAFDPYRSLSSATCNVIHCLIFGRRFEYTDDTCRNVMGNFDKIFSAGGMVNIFTVYPWLRYIIRNSEQDVRERALESIIDYIEGHIDDHRHSYTKDRVRDLVDLYIQRASSEDESLTKGNIFRVIMDLFFAGTETTASTLSWLFLYMVQFPKIQEKCRDEIMSAIGIDDPVKYEDRTKLNFVQATILETQRLSNIVQNSLPHCAEKDTYINGFFVPKDTTVIAHLASVHLEEGNFYNPRYFDPSRFLDSEGNLLKPKTFMPFSVGPRVCLGETLAKMELLVIFTTILQKFRLTKDSTEDVLDLSGVHYVTVRPDPYKMRALKIY